MFRAEGKLGSRYDPNVTVWDPFPFAPNQRTNDPVLDSIIAPTTTAMVDFITHTVGWKYAGRYDALSYEVAKLWTNADEKEEANQRLEHGSVEELRQSVAVDPKLNVLIVHGWDDLSCPFMASVNRGASRMSPSTRAKPGCVRALSRNGRRPVEKLS